MKINVRSSLFGLGMSLSVILLIIWLLWWQIGPRTTDPYLDMRGQWQKKMLSRYGENDLEKLAVMNLTNIYVRGAAISELPLKLTTLMPSDWDDQEKADYWRTIYLMVKAENDENESSRDIKMTNWGLLFHNFRFRQKVNSSFRLIKREIEKDGTTWLLHTNFDHGADAYIELRNKGLTPLYISQIKIIYSDGREENIKMEDDYYLFDGNIRLTNIKNGILSVDIKARNPAVETDISPEAIYLVDEANLRNLSE